MIAGESASLKVEQPFRVSSAAAAQSLQLVAGVFALGFRLLALTESDTRQSRQTFSCIFPLARCLVGSLPRCLYASLPFNFKPYCYNFVNL